MQRSLRPTIIQRHTLWKENKFDNYALLMVLSFVLY
jgi:hypothetical protein